MDPVAAYISSPAASPRVATPRVFAIPTSVSELKQTLNHRGSELAGDFLSRVPELRR
jgi:hypothetical protein